MMKFAFLMNMPGETPETCYGEYNNEKSHNRIVGMEKDAAAEYVMGLAEEGFDIVGLCGDFTERDVEILTKVSEGKISINYAKYSPVEMEKMDKLESLFEYGIIIFEDSIETTEWVEILNRQGNTYVAFVKDMDSAMEAGKELVKKGVAFMELCGWFNSERTGQIINAIGGVAPVGTCGNI